MPKYYYSIECEAIPAGKDQAFPPIGIWIADDKNLTPYYIKGKETRRVINFYLRQHPEYSPVEKLEWLSDRLSIYSGMVSVPVEIKDGSVEAIIKTFLDKILTENRRITGE